MAETTSPTTASLASTNVRLDVFIRYGLAGLVGTATHYLVMWALLGYMSEVTASTGGAIAGCLVNFLLNRAYAFRSELPVSATLIRFVTVGALCVLLNGLVVGVASQSFPIVPSQLAATVVVLIFGFTLNKSWTFHE
ncbi:MAG: GtrA family protein [Pseudomonadota bacterium]